MVVPSAYTTVKLEPHLHTLHSDGQDSIATMFAACRASGYDVVALTDHNTLSGLDEARPIARDLGLILIPGVEVTTFRGHAIVLGVSHVPEWRDLEERGMQALADDVHAEGGVLSVAHAASIGSPVCSGCAWEWPIEPERVDGWEVLSGPRHTDVPLELWRQLLQRGGSIAPMGAGDVHSTAAARASRPATFALVRERSCAGVLEALRARRVCASRGRALNFWLEDADGNTASPGETVQGGANWLPRSQPDALIRELACGDGRQCLYAELRDDQGRLEAVSAPIWISASH